MNDDAILIAGPTASGKTSFAIDLAKKYNGAIINTDSMQVYDILSVLTARPQLDEMEDIPHLLFGHVNPSHEYSIAKWIIDAQNALDEIRSLGKVPIFTGGTGLYFKTLLEGLSPVPNIDPDIRQKWRVFSNDCKSGDLHDALGSLDEKSAKLLRPSDTQRLVRALEVMESTGRPLHYWQSLGNKTALLSNMKTKKIILLPERSILRERAEQRFDQMIELGALKEVEQLLLLKLPEEMPAMRAIGVSFLAQYLKSELSLEKACELCVIATRQYAKRQSTWFRNQFGDDWAILSIQLGDT